jgi:hypothetical protein
MTVRASFVAFAIGFLGVSAAGAADITEDPPITATLFNPYPERGMELRNLGPMAQDFSASRHLRLEGDIAIGDVEKLQALVGEHQPLDSDVILSLNSNGGNLAAALAVADFVHANRVATYVGAGDVCLSSCAWIFLAGQNEWIRSVLFVPARYVHRDGRVGFHAPFNDQYPPGKVTDRSAMLLAEEYYEIARAAIREINARIAPWRISPHLVVELLGKGRTEFYDIDRFWRLTQNQIEMVVDDVGYPAEIGPIQAAAGCDFVYSINFGPSYEYGDTTARLQGPPAIHRRSGWMDAKASELDGIVRRDEGSGGRYFTFDGVMHGRGPFRCMVRRNKQGRWAVTTEGDYPLVTDRMGDDPRIDREPFELHDYALLGPDLPWSAVDAPDLYFEGVGQDGRFDDLELAIPSEYKSIQGPGFDCGGMLDPAALVICRFPLLSRVDGVMAALYRARVEADPAVRDSQKTWLKLRDDVCPISDGASDVIRLIDGYCLFYMTIVRINELRGS